MLATEELEQLQEFTELDETEFLPDEPEKNGHLPLINKIKPESLANGFGEFIDNLAQKVGLDSPIRIGETYSSVVVIPRALKTLGRVIDPKDTFGIRLWELLQLLTIPYELRDDAFAKRLRWEVNRTRGALLSFGRTSIARKLSQSGRVAILLTNRACDSIDPEEILINQKDAERYRLNAGDLVILGRYPGSTFSCHRVVINNKIPESCVYTPIKSLLSHQGDVDGDMVLIVKLT